MGQQLGLDHQAGAFPLSDSFAEMDGISVDYDGGEQVESCHAVVLALAGAVMDFALTPDAECVLEGVMSPALVQAGVDSALHIDVEEPVNDEEGAFGPSDFAESEVQFVLAGIGGGLSQQLAGRQDATGQGGSNTQDVRPFPHNEVLPDVRAIAGQLRERGVKLALGRTPYDTGDSKGKMVFNILAIFAEFEADFRCMRSREGMAARARGNCEASSPI